MAVVNSPPGFPRTSTTSRFHPLAVQVPQSLVAFLGTVLGEFFEFDIADAVFEHFDFADAMNFHAAPHEFHLGHAVIPSHAERQLTAGRSGNLVDRRVECASGDTLAVDRLDNVTPFAARPQPPDRPEERWRSTCPAHPP